MKTGAQLKSEGIDRAFTNAAEQWKANAMTRLQMFCEKNAEFRAEDFRLWFMTTGGTAPHVPNVWAGLFASAVSLGIVSPTGRFVKSNAPATRAHRVQVYRRGKRLTKPATLLPSAAPRVVQGELPL